MRIYQGRSVKTNPSWLTLNNGKCAIGHDTSYQLISKIYDDYECSTCRNWTGCGGSCRRLISDEYTVYTCETCNSRDIHECQSCSIKSDHWMAIGDIIYGSCCYYDRSNEHKTEWIIDNPDPSTSNIIYKIDVIDDNMYEWVISYRISNCIECNNIMDTRESIPSSYVENNSLCKSCYIIQWIVDNPDPSTSTIEYSVTYPNQLKNHESFYIEYKRLEWIVTSYINACARCNNAYKSIIEDTICDRCVAYNPYIKIINDNVRKFKRVGYMKCNRVQLKPPERSTRHSWKSSKLSSGRYITEIDHYKLGLGLYLPNKIHITILNDYNCDCGKCPKWP